MPLSDDQRALLRLLAQREEGYDDIAALMGLSVDEVRRRVKAAVAELDEAALAAGPVGAGDPPPPPVAEASSEVVPPAPPPAEKTPPAPRAPRSAPRPAPRSAGNRLALSASRRRLWELVGGALVVLLLVLFATGAVDLGGDDSGDSDSSSQAGALKVDNGKITQAALEPVGGGEAKGNALFGKLGKQVVMQVLAEGLEPSAPGETYAIWLYRSPKLALRVGAVKVPESGQLAVRLPVPTELLALVANGAFPQVAISRTANADYQAEVAAAKGKQRLPRYTGETVLRGNLTGPLAESANKGR